MAAAAVLSALDETWNALAPLHLRMAVMGGLGLAAWKYPRATRDVDLLIGIESVQPEMLIRLLEGSGFRAKRTPAIRSLGSMQLLQMEFEPREAFVAIPVDLMLVDSKYHQIALERAVPFRLPGVNAELYVLSCEDLILNKLIAGRMIDRSDSAALIRANCDTLDVGYLAKWVPELQLEPDFREVWNEADPSTPSPI